MVRHARSQLVCNGEHKKWLTTPEGWARAKLLLLTCRELPPVGSPREVVLLSLILAQETAEHAKFRALMQATIDASSARSAFDEYMEAAFPYLHSAKKRDAMDAAKILEQELARGPLSVRRLDTLHKQRPTATIKAPRVTQARDSKEIDAMVMGSSFSKSLEDRFKK